MNFDTVFLILALWVAASVPLSLAMAGRMRGVAVREARAHRGSRAAARANRVPRPPREFRRPGETHTLAQLRTRVSMSGLRTRRRLRLADLEIAA